MDTLERNDTQGAFEAFKAEWKRTKGKPDADLCQTLVMLQDDSRAYRKLVTEFLESRGSKA